MQIDCYLDRLAPKKQTAAERPTSSIRTPYFDQNDSFAKRVSSQVERRASRVSLT
jgi:hypothetical protein